MCKKVLINPETESFINDLKREYNNSIVKPYKKTRDVLEILMKKFVLYQKVSIQKMDAITRATLETLPIKNLNVSDIYIVKDNEISHSFYLYFHSRYALEPFLCVVYDNDTDRLYSNCAMLEMYITILHGIDVGEIETDSIKYHNYRYIHIMNVKKRLNTKECTLVDTFKESRGILVDSTYLDWAN